jgi:hypothetical protein
VAGIAVLVSVGCARPSHGGNTAGPPTCANLQSCGQGGDGQASCTFADTSQIAGTPVIGTTVIADFPDGISSDGRGPYAPGTDGVLGSSISGVSLRYPRKLKVNLNSPVPGSGAVPLGIVTDGENSRWNPEKPYFGLFWDLEAVGHEIQDPRSIQVGQTVPAGQINVFFHINGRFHILQMGPQALGHCHTRRNPVNGSGTSSGTIYRAGSTDWVVELPAGSIGRLFDMSRTLPYTVDKGLYYVHLRFELHK